jgi:hypothetical protein
MLCAIFAMLLVLGVVGFLASYTLVWRDHANFTD